MIPLPTPWENNIMQALGTLKPTPPPAKLKNINRKL
jgi:hypothetical protein